MLKRKFYLKLLMGLLLMAFIVPQAWAETADVGGSSPTTTVPLNGMYGDYGYHSQMVYSQAMLEEAGLPAGAKITAITFYAQGNISATSGSENNPLTIKMGQPDGTSLSSFITDGLTTVSTTGDIWSGNTSVTLQFDSEYSYDGGNLLIDVSWSRNASGKYGTINWLASSATGASRYANNNSSGVEQSSTTGQYLPKITFTYEAGSVEPVTSGEVLTTSLEFNTYAGVAKTDVVSIKNTGNQPFTPTFSTLNAPFSIEAATEIPARQTKDFIVTYNRATVGSDNATLVVTINGATTNVTLTGNATEAPKVVTVAEDGTSDNSYIPICGSYFDTQGSYGQTIYSKSELGLLAGKNITKVKYYSNTTFDATKIAGTVLEIYLMETSSNSVIPEGGYSSQPLSFTGASLGEYTVVGGETDIEFNLSTPFNYSGNNNLAIQVKVKTASPQTGTRYQSINWIGKDVTGDNISYYYTNSGSGNKFLPKTTFSYAETGPVPTITVDPATVEAFTTEVGTPVTATVNVAGENLTGDITATVSGDDAFTAVLENGVLTITYNPTVAGNHTATLTLSSEGARNVTIDLSGTATAPAVPTITVNPATLTINAALGETKTASFTVTGANLEDDIAIAASEGFSVSPTTIAAADAATGATVTVTYVAPTTAETKTGTITLTSEGAETKTVAITATAADITYDFTVEPESLDFGEVYVGQSNILAVTIKNNGNDNINPVFTFNNNVFTVEDDSYPVYGGLSQQYNIIYTPVAAGTDNGTVQITIGSQTVTVSLNGKGKELAAYDIASTAASGVHNFGDAFVNGTASWSFTITNNGKNDVTPTIEGLAAPFSTTYESAAIASGESATITINFAPTEIKAYGPTSIVVKFAETADFQFDYTLRGNGIENTGTLPPSFYDNIEYTWTDANGDTQTSKLTDIATTPEQMIALMREVYTNKNLPGPWYRGYDSNGNPETGYPVPYPAIGTMTRFGAFEVATNYTFNDAYGWGIAHDETNYPSQLLYHGSSSHNYYKGLNGNEYKPNEEGLTILLVEMKDGANSNTVSRTISSSNTLVNIFDKMFKSVRVITNSKKVTKNGVEGTLFKIDCDKMNRFFFLGKGRLRLQGENDADGLLGRSNYFIDKDNQTSSTSSITNVANDGAPFFEMFEQFSPVSLIEGTESSDVYQELINMQSYSVEHDCVYIPWAPAQTTGGEAGHEFNMYGKESISDDCQDVRDLMFFIPDQRMKAWTSRDRGANDKFVNYYQQNAPTMAMYVIKQNEITGNPTEGVENSYTLNLSWQSNLTDFVPGENGQYTIYQVNDDGTYTEVATVPSSQTTYTLDVAMQQHGQQVTYVIQGQDNTRFLSLQYSNEQSFIIPGLDPTEKFQMIANADYYSRYNPADEHNYYANGMQVMAYPDVNASDYAGKTFNFYRKAAGENDWTLVATASVNNEGTGATVSMVETTQRLESDYKFGYKQNPATIAMTADANANKKFDVIYDNFKADVSANDHATSYSYKMETADGAYHSNEIAIKVFKTAMSNITGSFDWAYVEGDDVRQVADKGTQFDVDVQLSSKTEILRYGAYRWDSSYGTDSNPYAVLNLNSATDSEEDISPAGQASNQGEYYSVYMNGDSYKGDDVYVAQGETGKATFVDNVPETAVDEYTYVPVIETFTGRSDYNTYGAPMQETATGELDITVGEKKQSGDITWTADGKTYTYYNVCLNVNELQIPQGYEVAMLRAWRQIDPSYLGEQSGKGYENRAVLDANGDFLFLKDAENGFGEVIGDEILVNQEGQYGNIFSGTFGAVKLENGQTIPMKFTVRVYFTKSESTSNAPRLKAEGESKKYYITEIELNDELTSDIPTSIFGVVTGKAVAGVKYYNVAGVESDRPFQGVNIEVTRYTDGSKSTRKILK